MKLNEKTLKFIESCITGDSNITSYKSGPELVKYFNSLGFNDQYAAGFPSRWYYVDQKLQEINGTQRMEDLILDFYLPINFVDNKEHGNIIGELNRFLYFDDYELIIEGKNTKIIKIGEKVEISNTDGKIDTEIISMVNFNDDYIGEQFKKCSNKLANEDYDGAITNARTLIESAFGHIYYIVNKEQLDKTGDLQKDYKKIKDCLDLTGEQRSDDAMKSIVNNISGIINGIDSLSNSMGDRHRRTIKPRLYQAQFIVESAICLTNYIYGVFKYNLHSIDDILEKIRLLFQKNNIYWYNLDVKKEEQYNQIHNHPISIGLKDRLTALKGNELVKYLVETVDIHSREASGLFFGSMILLDDYLSKDMVEEIVKKTIVSYNDQAVHLRWFLTNLYNNKKHLLGDLAIKLIETMITLDIRSLTTLAYRSEELVLVPKIKQIKMEKFIIGLLEDYSQPNDKEVKWLIEQLSH